VPSGLNPTLSYSSGQLSSVTNAGSETLSFTYNSSGYIATVTDPLTRATSYGYDSYGDLTSVTDPLGHVTSFTYNTTSHLLLTVTKPNGQSGGPDAGDKLTNTYNSSGQVLSQIDPDGNETTFAYTGNNASSSGGTTTITDPDGNVTLQDYTSNLLMSQTTGYGTSSAATTTYTYDSNDDLLTITDPNSHTTTNTYDTNGNLTSTENALGFTTTYASNSFGEQTCLAAPLAASPCSSLSPPGAITAGTATITPPSSAPPKYVTYTEYDTDGNQIYQTTGDYAPGGSTASQSRTTRRFVHHLRTVDQPPVRHHRCRRCGYPARLRQPRQPDLQVHPRWEQSLGSGHHQHPHRRPHGSPAGHRGCPERRTSRHGDGWRYPLCLCDQQRGKRHQPDQSLH
jgi:YD repeat-containing protein